MHGLWTHDGLIPNSLQPNKFISQSQIYIPIKCLRILAFCWNSGWLMKNHEMETQCPLSMMHCIKHIFSLQSKHIPNTNIEQWKAFSPKLPENILMLHINWWRSKVRIMWKFTSGHLHFCTSEISKNQPPLP